MLLTTLAPLRMSEIFDPPSAAELMMGHTLGAVLAGMIAVALLGLPLLRGVAMFGHLTRWLVQTVARTRPQVIAEVERPLHVGELSPALASLARQTRTLALELRRRSAVAAHWPEDAEQLEDVQIERGSWWRSLVSESVDFRPLLDTRREVFDWLDSVAALDEHERGRLAELGVDVEHVRASLTADGPIADRIRTLAGLLWAIDERLAGASTSGYRSSGAGIGAEHPVGPLADDDDELERQRWARRRFQELFGRQRHGLSRMAGSYARSTAEREDLEQDIALALWSSLPRFRGEAKLETFAYRVARYCCYAHSRRRNRTSSEDLEQSVADPDNFEQQLLDADARAQLHRAVAELPETLATTISLHLSGLSYAEIAARLGISEQNVSVRLTRARQRLEHQLTEAAA
jgi:RNA polymerase sigma factor (sigma-70 family)